MTAPQRLLWMVAGAAIWLIIDRVLSVGRRRRGWSPTLTVELVQYSVISWLYLGALAIAPDPFRVRVEMSDPQFACLALNMGYFLYGGLRGLTRLGREPPTILLHHASLAVGSAIFLAFAPMQQMICWVGVLQLNSMIHEVGRALRNAGRMPPQRWARFMTLELVGFVVCRWVIFPPLVIFLMFDALTVEPTMPVLAWICGLLLPVLFGLHAHWLRKTLQRWRRAQQAAR